MTDGIEFPIIENAGEQAGQAKLTEKEAIEIYQLAKAGGSPYEIADKYNISFTTVYDIYKGRSWKNIPRD